MNPTDLNELNQNYTILLQNYSEMIQKPDCDPQVREDLNAKMELIKRTIKDLNLALESLNCQILEHKVHLTPEEKEEILVTHHVWDLFKVFFHFISLYHFENFAIP